MKSVKFKLMAVFAFACSLSIAGAASAQTTDHNMLACQPVQTIQIGNGLANSTLPDSGMTKTAVLIKYYNNNKVCWEFKIDYAGTDNFKAGSGCGCRQPADKIDIQPVIRAGDKLSAYGTQTVTIPPPNPALPPQLVQVSIGQESGPAFDSRSGLIVTQGTIKAALQVLPPR